MAAKRKESVEAQHLRFKQMARDLGADESPEAFDRTLKRIAQGSPRQSQNQPSECEMPSGARMQSIGARTTK